MIVYIVVTAVVTVLADRWFVSQRSSGKNPYKTIKDGIVKVIKGILKFGRDIINDIRGKQEGSDKAV